MAIINRIGEFHQDMTAWRRDFHENPELGFEERRTSAIVADQLKAFGVDEIHTGIAKTGVVGVLRSGTGSGSIGLRADMDALPIDETSGVPHASRTAGKMHACGHDGHTTMLLGAARYLAETRNFEGTVYLIFQPAEEMLGGGRVMLEEGLLERFPMTQLYGLHNWPKMPVGSFAVRSGPMMAAADRFTLNLRGQGGHGAMPEIARDPLVAAAQIVLAMQTIVARNVDPGKQAVVSVTQIQGGDAYNVIPETAMIAGTCRAFEPEVRDLIERRITAIGHSVGEALQIEVDVQYERGYPPTVNSEVETEFAANAAAEVVGDERVDRAVTPVMGAEDFSFMLEQRPGSYIFMGSGREDAPLHSPHYDFNDEALTVGASYWARLVERLLPAA